MVKKFNAIGKGVKSFILMGLASILLGGCISDPNVRPGLGNTLLFGGTKNELIAKSDISQTKREIKNPEKIVENASITQDEKAGTLTISGQIYGKYTKEEWSESEETWETTQYGAYGIETSRIQWKKKIIDGARSTEEKIIPKEARLGLNFEGGCLQKDVFVDNAGSFSTDIKNPKLKKEFIPYMSLRHRMKDVSAGIKKDDPNNLEKISFIYGGYMGEFKDYVQLVDEERVTKFIKEKIVFNLEVSVKDRSTQEPISPKIKLKVSSIPNLEEQLKNEIKDERAYNYGIDMIKEHYLKGYLKEGETKEVQNQSISFPAVEGGVYSIETTEPNYYHEKINITAERKKPKKIILLTETGQKIRVDSSTEGRGVVIDGE